MTALKEELSNPSPPKLSAREKAAVTDETARAIIAAEVSSREEKTERLRLMRLQQQEKAVKAAPATRKRRVSKDH
jgi:hypothetical protein